MPYHQPVIVGNVTHNLDHLDPVTFNTPSEKLRREIVTWCRFTTHVFTRQPAAADRGPFLVDEGRRQRVFCPDRYSLSMSLPRIMRMMQDPGCYVTETAAERNWLHRAEVEIETAAGPVAYQVFFAVKKARRADRHDVEMTVESAYAFDPARPPPVRGRMVIAGLLTATVEGRTPHTQKAR